jgi:eukaryotic-like serine/threonine-protein kinase
VTDVTLLEGELQRGTRIFRKGSSAKGNDYFEVEEPCGDPGGQARVYRCFDHSEGRYVALKLWHSYVYSHRAADARKEAALLKKIHDEKIPGHEHVIGYFDSFDTAPIDMGQGNHGAVTFALVMEYADGGSLKSLMAVGPVSRALAERIAADICDGLTAVHAVGWHNDLKPANILRVGEMFKVGDLGIARVLDGKDYSRFPPANLTYMAFERRLDEKVSREGDIFSFGVIFHELLTAKTPDEIRERDRPPRCNPARGLPRRHRHLIASCLEWDVSKRPNAASIAKRLPTASTIPLPTVLPPPTGSTEGVSPCETGSAASATATPWRRGRGRLWVTGAGATFALVIALVVVGLQLGSGNKTPQNRRGTSTTIRPGSTSPAEGPSPDTYSTKSALDPTILGSSTNTESASASSQLDLGGTAISEGIYGGESGLTPATYAMCGPVGVTGSCSSFTLNLQGKYDLLSASIGELSSSTSDCAVELDTYEGTNNVDEGKFLGAQPPSALSMNVTGVSQITFTWSSSSASGGVCAFGFGNPYVAPPTLPSPFYYLNSLPIRVTVPSFCDCAFPDGYGEIKAKVYVTNATLSTGLPIAGTNMYRIRLMVASQPLGWSSPWSSTTGQPTLVALPKARGNTYRVWTIPPNPVDDAQTLSGTTTWATHWDPPSATLEQGQAYSDAGVKMDDLTYSVPQGIDPIGIVIFSGTGKVVGYTFELPSSSSDGNTF